MKAKMKRGVQRERKLWLMTGRKWVCASRQPMVLQQTESEYQRDGEQGIGTSLRRNPSGVSIDRALGKVHGLT